MLLVCANPNMVVRKLTYLHQLYNEYVNKSQMELIRLLLPWGEFKKQTVFFLLFLLE